MTAALFLAGTALLALAWVLSVRRYLSVPAARLASVGLGAWLLYVGTLSALGVVGDPTLRPPGVLYIVVPVVAFVVLFAARSTRGGEVARALPISLLIGTQGFRVAVELGLHRLWVQGLVPRLMTYEGGNIDLFIGLSAPLVAWMLHRGLIGRRLAQAWNVVGLLALANIIVRSALTAPGALNFVHAEVPNLAIGTFPFTFIAGFFAPLAVFMHVLSLRHLSAARRAPASLAGIGQFGAAGPARELDLRRSAR